YGSLPYLITDKTVQQIIVSPYFKWENNILEEVKLKQKNLTVVEKETVIQIKGQDLLVLAPLEDLHDANNNSLVLYTEFGQSSWMFTGDIEAEVEKKLIERYPHLSVDVLKVAHHGSSTST